MKKKIFVLIANALLFYCFQAAAQWQLGGNSLVGDSRLGSNNAFDVLLETNDTIRGRLTRTGLWGIGNNIIPNARLHVNSLAGENAFRVQVAGSTKLLVNSSGGVSVGSLSAPPANGLFVSGKTGIGTNTPASTLDILGGNWDVGSTEGDLRIGNSTYRLKIGVATGGGGAGDARIRAVGGTNRIMLGVNDALTINGSGNVGIETTNPAGKLHVFHNSSVTHPQLLLYENQSDYARINFQNTNTSNFFAIAGNPHANNSQALLNFYYNVTGDIMTIRGDGNVSIGTTTPATGYKLSVAGKIICEEMKVQLKANWPDYVFEKNYKLSSIDELEKFIQSNKHLPGIPSSAEITNNNGFEIGEMQRKMVEKLEEQALYIIQLKKEIEILKAMILLAANK